MIRKYALILFFLLPLLSFSQKKGPKIGIVLSGGGAKGYAHVGALEVLEEAGIPVDYIGGTSMGAVVGGLYASGYPAKQLEEILYEIDFQRLIFDNTPREMKPFYQKQFDEKYILSLNFDKFKLTLPRSISKGQGTFNVLTKYFQHVHVVDKFKDLSIPFLCIGTDIETGKQKIFDRGYLPESVMASASYPTLFSPVKIDSNYYIDGGIVNNFPVQEVKDMGADIIIGVDLGEGLAKEDQLDNAIDVLEQIVSFRIEEKTNEQRKKADIIIKPNIKGFGVTSFDSKDTLIQVGRIAAKKALPKIDSLLKQAKKRFVPRKYQQVNGIFVLEKVEINGLKNYSENYVFGRTGFETPQAINYELILKGVDELYSTGNFKNIYTRLEETKTGGRKLVLDIIENESNIYTKFGLHYDELFKSSLLVNFTIKNLFTINSTLSLDGIVGDKPRYSFNYFVDNGILPSFGLSADFKQFDVDQSVAISDNTEIDLNYSVKSFTNKAYTQSTLKEQLAAGLGVEHQYLKVSTNSLKKTNKWQEYQNNHFYSLYAFLKADSRNSKFYPTSGLRFDALFNYMALSSQEDFEPAYYLKSDIEANIPLNKNFTFQANGFLNTYFAYNIPPGFEMYLGGQNQQSILNSKPFYGLDFGEVVGGSIFGVGSGIQYRFFTNHYLKGDVQLAAISSEIRTMNFLKLDYQGYGLTYGYMSPFGPIQASLSYSPTNGKVLPYISLGYWF